MFFLFSQFPLLNVFPTATAPYKDKIPDISVMIGPHFGPFLYLALLSINSSCYQLIKSLPLSGSVLLQNPPMSNVSPLGLQKNCEGRDNRGLRNYSQFLNLFTC